MTDATERPWHVTMASARAIPIPEGQRSAICLSHGSMTVKYYAPRGVDRQTPHTQDELYVVATGDGCFFDGGVRRRVGVGDVLFVPAGRAHRFEDFTEGFAVWVIFYGPEGGESAGPMRG